MRARVYPVISEKVVDRLLETYHSSEISLLRSESFPYRQRPSCDHQLGKSSPTTIYWSFHLGWSRTVSKGSGSSDPPTDSTDG